eukprot:TRINITY_DN10234_c0_g1_i6.p2 TRINITY_DN10234_c0_g1~~TRINITY_DN10234_c0_g1_i6.p2  ORF type:complete len:144 (-),score=40.00 TRINITY_DN10234_c0_g1_i6:85-516(-)
MFYLYYLFILLYSIIYFFFFFFKQKTAYEMLRSLVGSEMCIRDRWWCWFRCAGFDAAPLVASLRVATSRFKHLGAEVALLRAGGHVSHSRPCRVGRAVHLMPPTLAPVLCVDTCLLYTSDAADEEDSVDLGGRRIIKKKKKDI